MKTNKKYFRLVFALWICVLFLIGPKSFNEINTNINWNSNQLHNSIAATDLSYYIWGGSGWDYAGDIAIDSSNNSYVVGHTESFGAGELDLCLIKFNSSGIEWNRTFGGIYNDCGRSIVLDSFDNIFITGDTESFGAGGSDMWVLKINSTGGTEWNYTWGGVYDEIGRGIAIDSLNNAYVTGYTRSFGKGLSDMCLVKFNSSGVVWNYTWGGSDMDVGYSVTLDPLGNAYVVGDTESFGAGKTDMYLAKFNSTGMLWNYTWGGIENDHGTEIIFTPSGELYVSGYSEILSPLFNVEYDICLVKFNAEGAYQWNNTWKEGYWDYSFGMVMDSSGNVYLSGYTNSDHYNDYDMCLLRFNSTGVIDWYCTWGGKNTEHSMGVVLGSNGTALVTGYTRSYGAGGGDICIVQFLIGQCPVPEIINDTTIPGYDTVILIGIASAVTIYVIKKKSYHNKERKLHTSNLES